MLASVHQAMPFDRQVWSLSGLALAIVYAVLARANYLTQFVVVQPALLNGETDGLVYLLAANPHSIFWALANAYAIQALALLCLAYSVGRDRLEGWQRWTCTAVGPTAPLQFAQTLGLLPLMAGLFVFAIWMVGIPLF